MNVGNVLFPLTVLCRKFSADKRPHTGTCRPIVVAPHWQRGRLLLVLIGALLSVATPARAQLPTTQLMAIFPTGGKQGTQLELTITSGADLDGVHQLIFSHPGITAVQKTQKVEGKAEPQPVAKQFVVSIAADVPPGRYEVRASGNYGVSNPRMFVVGPQAQIVEKEPNDRPDQATELPLETFVDGRSNKAADVDFYRFTATAGQRLVISCLAETIDSRMDATLVLYDAQNVRLAASRDFHRREPLIDFVVPADGQYVLKVFDFTYGGGNEHFYRLLISRKPYLDFAMPPAVAAGPEQTNIALFGRNLPEGAATDAVGHDGRPLERREVPFTLPDEVSKLLRFQWADYVPVHEAAIDAAAFRLSSELGPSNAIHIARATAPVVLEHEPNDTPDQSQPLSIPCEVAGQFQSRGDVDWLHFEAEKDQVLWIEVISTRAGAPTDPHLLVQMVTTNDKGQQQVKDLAAIDYQKDGTADFRLYAEAPSDDPVYRLKAPAKATYRIRLADLYRELRGDASLVYRVSIRPETPDFRLVATPAKPRNLTDANQRKAIDPWPLRLRKAGRQQVRVFAFRQHGFNGPIDVTVEGLPAGVSADPLTIGPGQREARLILTAAADAADWHGPIRLIGKAQIGDSEQTREARSATVVWSAAGPPGRVRLSRALVLSVGETDPFRVDAAWPSNITVPQGQQLAVPIKAVRHGEFKGQIDLAGVLLPPNVQPFALSLKPDQSEGIFYLFIQPNAPPGRYSLFLQATSKVSVKKPNDKKASDRVIYLPSNAVTFTIEPAPLTLTAKVPGGGAIKRGGSIEIPVEVKRRNGATGAVKLDLQLPAGVSGITAPEVEVPADANQAKLAVAAAADATEGQHAHVVVRARIEQDGRTIEVHQPITLNVQK